MTGSERGSSSVPSQTSFRETLGRFASGVVVVSGLDESGPAGLTCQSFFSVSLDPPLIAVSPSLKSSSWRRIADTGAFAVSVLEARQRELCLSFGQGGQRDKFASTPWTPAPSGSPFIDGALAWLDCRIAAIHPAGDHYLVLGEVTHVWAGSGDPLIFSHGSLGTFARRVLDGRAIDDVWGIGPWQEGIDW